MNPYNWSKCKLEPIKQKTFVTLFKYIFRIPLQILCGERFKFKIKKHMFLKIGF